MRLCFSPWPVPLGALGNLTVRIADSNGNVHRKFIFDTVQCSLVNEIYLELQGRYVQRVTNDCAEARDTWIACFRGQVVIAYPTPHNLIMV